MDNKYYLDLNGLKELIKKNVRLGDYYIFMNVPNLDDLGAQDPLYINLTDYLNDGVVIEYNRVQGSNITTIPDNYGTIPNDDIFYQMISGNVNVILTEHTSGSILDANYHVFHLDEHDYVANRDDLYIFKSQSTDRQLIYDASTGLWSLKINPLSPKVVMEVIADYNSQNPTAEVPAGQLRVKPSSPIVINKMIGGELIDGYDWDAKDNITNLTINLKFTQAQLDALLNQSSTYDTGDDSYVYIVLNYVGTDVDNNSALYRSAPLRNNTSESPMFVISGLFNTSIAASIDSSLSLSVELIRPIAPSDIVTELNYNGPYTVTLKNTGNYSPNTLINAFQINDVDVSSPSLDTPVSIQRGDKVYVKFKIPANGQYTYTANLQVTQDSSYEEYTRNNTINPPAVEVTIPYVKGNSVIDAKLTRSGGITPGGGGGGGVSPTPAG